MNQYLQNFVSDKFTQPGKALDLGAGDLHDVEGMKKLGWECWGVDKKTGVDLEDVYLADDRPFDLVYSNYVWQKLENRNNLIKTASDNLKKGGWFFIHTFDASDENSGSDIDMDSAKNVLAEGGFGNISGRIIDFYDDEPGHEHRHKILEIHARR